MRKKEDLKPSQSGLLLRKVRGRNMIPRHKSKQCSSQLNMSTKNRLSCRLLLVTDPHSDVNSQSSMSASQTPPQKCANCLLFGWAQPEDPGSLQRCGKCKVLQYCDKECQAEHWMLVDKLARLTVIWICEFENRETAMLSRCSPLLCVLSPIQPT